jgi:tRNA/tmRNA/rRNA uracil-C5-methylase (TrmA/RlmC/RlmD family)
MELLAERLRARENGKSDVEKLRIRLEHSSVLASSDSLPDQPLYPVKIAVEETLLKLTTSELVQARLRIEFAERRVQEMVEIGKSDKPQELEELVQSVEQQLDQIEPLAESLMSQKNKERDVEEIKTLLEQAAIRNRDMLRETLEKAPSQTRPALEQALERSRLRYEKELESLNEIKQRTEHKPNSGKPQPNPPGQFK